MSVSRLLGQCSIGICVLPALLLCIPTAAIASPAPGLPVAPIHLACDGMTHPPGIDDPTPTLGWMIADSPTKRGMRQTAYEIRVASSPAKLQSADCDLWDSGLVNSDESAHVQYAGKPLASGKCYYWQVRVVDQSGGVSPFSEPATFGVAMLAGSDWSAKWISALTQDVDDETGGNGYLSAPAKSYLEPKWVQVDLGKPTPIERIVLHPLIPYITWRPAGVPESRFRFDASAWRYRVDVSDTADFVKFTTVADRQPKPPGSVYMRSLVVPDRIDVSGVTARYVRVTATHLWLEPLPAYGPYAFGLGQLQVFSGGVNVALNKPVTARDSRESDGFGKAQLTDGHRLINAVAEQVGDGSILLRKSVTLDRVPVRATAYVTGLGYYRLWINGQAIGDEVLAPGFTDPTKRVLYETFDVTDQIKAGENAIAASVGNGWYRIPTPENFSFRRAPWRGPLKFLCQIDIEFSDGSRQTIATDESWKWSTGADTYNCVRGGTTWDARRDKPGWNNVGCDDSTWNQAVVSPAPAGRLVADAQPPIRVHQMVTPVKLSQPKPGIWVYDLGANISGYARFAMSGEAGQKITLQYNEVLKPDGEVDVGHGGYFSMSRFQTDIFICSGKGKEIFTPEFTYHGFRYVQVTGLSAAPSLDDLTGVWFGSDPAPAGEFACSNDSVSAVLAAYRRTQLDNWESIPTDCPTREKLGWTCDGSITEESALYNFDADRFYRKWQHDLEDAQDASGHVPAIVPTPGWGKSPGKNLPGVYSCPWWGGAIVRVPWTLYQFGGDRRQLALAYPAMKAYVDFIGKTSPNFIVTWGLGDWLDESADVGVKRTMGQRKAPLWLTSTAAYYLYARIIAQAAAALGKSDDAGAYDALTKKIADAFNKKFLKPDGEYAHDAQTAQAMAIDFGLAPADMLPAVRAVFVDDIANVRHGHLNSGIVGTLYVFHALAKIGRDDLAYTVFSNPTYPSLPAMLNAGATTFWECWSPPGGMSYNHPALGSPIEWLYSGLAGIDIDPDHPGFKHIVIKPAIVGDLTWARASYQCPYGLIASAWRRDGDKRTLDVTIPPNTTASIFVPTSDPSTITEGGKPAASAEGVKFVESTSAFAQFLVGSGHYQFQSR